MVNVAKTESVWQELAAGTATALATGFGAYEHFVSSGALDGFREMKVWDAGLISDPVYVAGTIAVVAFCGGALAVKEAREYFSKG
jgi:hypothetical protein